MNKAHFKDSKRGNDNLAEADSENKSGSWQDRNSVKEKDCSKGLPTDLSAIPERQRAAIEERIDEALKESFPASDPPASYRIE